MSYCTKCGNKLSDDALFCDKCGTRAEKNTGNESITNDDSAIDPFSVEYTDNDDSIYEPGENENKQKHRKLTLIISICTVVIAIMIASLCIILNFQKTSETANSNDTVEVEQKEEKQNNDLTEAEILRDEYFADIQAMSVSGEALVRNPDIFKNAWIYTSGKVINILKSEKDNSFSLQIDSDYFGSEIPGVIIQGTYKSTDKRYITDDDIYGMGKFSGVDLFTYTDNGGSINAGILKDFIFKYWGFGSYDMQDIKTIVSSIFDRNDIDIRSEETNGDGVSYTFTTTNENGINLKWDLSDISGCFGKIFVSFDNGDNLYYVTFDNDYKHFYATEPRVNDGIFVIKYCDLNGNEVWKRDFEINSNSSSYNDIVTVNGKTYLLFGNNLYMLKKSNGKDVANPVLIKGCDSMIRYRDSLIVYGNNDAEIFALDFNGNIIWSNNLESTYDGCRLCAIQLIDSELLVSYSNTYTNIKDSRMIYRRINADTGENINQLVI